MIAYKLTQQDMTTHNGYQWILGEKRMTSGKGELCSDGWLHFYFNPVLAVLLNPIHASIAAPRLFRVVVGDVQKHDHQLKGGTTELTLIEEMELPVVTRVQRVAFGILCAVEVYSDPKWAKWASGWLSGEDRSEKIADALFRRAFTATPAYAAASAAARAATRAAADPAADAAAAASAAVDAAELDLIAISQKALLTT